MKLRALLLSGVLLGSVGFAPAETSSVDEGYIGSDNLQPLLNLPHVDAKNEDAASGSDIEFFTRSYPVGTTVLAGAEQELVDADPTTPTVERTYALAGTTGNGMHIYDITVPETTFRTARWDCSANQGDSQIFTRDGRTYATYTTEDSRPVAPNFACAKEVRANAASGSVPSGDLVGTFIVDLTDPYEPFGRAFISVPEGSHNGTVHPSGDYFYNSNSSLYTDTALDGGAGIEYYDISDLDAIERLGRFLLPPVPASLGTESHDITFGADGDRAYSAALSQGVIIDTTDPANPELVTTFSDPTINVWHQSDPITLTADDGTSRELLVVEDEVAGAVGTGQCPNGGVHIFDITGPLELKPLKLGYWNIDEARVMATEDGVSATGGCTAHVFRLYPEAGIMTIAYYNGGVRIVDLGELVGIGLGASAIVNSPISGDPMTQLAYGRFPDSNAWSAKAPTVDPETGEMYLFANDLNRGLDVFHYDGTGDPEAQAMGRWMSPAEAEVELTRFTVEELTANPQYVCFL